MDKEEFVYFINELKEEGDILGIFFAYFYYIISFIIGAEE